MNNNTSFDKLVNKVGNKFLLTAAVAKRAVQIKDGDNPLVNEDSSHPVIAAIEEIGEEKIIMGLSSKKEISHTQAIFDEEDDFEAEEEVDEDKKKDLKKKKSKSISTI